MQIDRQVQLKMLPTRMCSWYLVRQKEGHDDVSSADLPSPHDKRDSNRPVNSVVSAVLIHKKLQFCWVGVLDDLG